MEREGLDTARGARLRQWLRKMASHRLFPLAVAILAVLLTLSSLSAGLFVDDYHHRLLMTDSQSPARLLKSPLDMFRFLDGDPEQTYRIGQRVELAGMTVDVRQITPDGRPLEAAFIFPVPLEDPSLCWFQYTDAGFEPFSPPSIGQEMVLAAPPSPWRR